MKTYCGWLGTLVTLMALGFSPRISPAWAQTDPQLVNLNDDQPVFLVDPVDNGLWGHAWPAGQTLTVTIGDAGAPHFESDPILVNEWGDWYFWGIDYDVQPGELITITCGAVVKAHVVAALAIVDVDPEADTVSGTAAPGVWVEVGVHDEEVGRQVQADDEGVWVAEFSVAAGEDGWDRAFDIEVGMAGFAAQRDADDDETHLQWLAERSRPQIQVQPPVHHFGYVNLGDTVTQVFAVVNIGKLPLDLGTVVLADGLDLAHFAIVADNSSGRTLEPRGMTTGLVTVVFAPTNIWGKAVALQLPSNDDENPVLTVSLYGAGSSASAADTRFQAGLASLAAYTHGDPRDRNDLLDAHVAFGEVLVIQPEHPGAALYWLLTRFAMLPDVPQVSQLLDDFGFPSPGRDLMEWAAEASDPLPGTSPTLDRVVHVIAQAFDDLITEGMDHLGRIPSEWSGSIILTPNELPIDNAVQVDIGDVRMVQCGLALLRGALAMLQAHDWFFDFKHLDHLDTPLATIVVDGDPADWAGIRPIHVDDHGDHLGPDSADIYRVYTAMDATHAYLMLETYGAPIHPEAPISFFLNYRPGQHLWMSAPQDEHDFEHDDLAIRFSNDAVLDAWDTNTVTLADVLVARGDVFEAAIPLSELGNPDYFTATYVNIWPFGLPPELPGDPSNIEIPLTAYLAAYPQLGTLTDPGRFASAATSFTEAIDFYLAASELIRSETDYQHDDLFVIDPGELESESRFRRFLRQTRDSLAGVSATPFRMEISQFLDLEYAFMNPVGLRESATGTGFQRALSAVCLYQIDRALANLATADAAFMERLSPEDSPFDQTIDVDSGDLSMMKAWLNFWKGLIHVAQAYDLDVDPFELADQDPFLWEAVFNTHDQLLEVTNPPALATAASALNAAWNSYLTGMDGMDARIDPADHLFLIRDNRLFMAGAAVSDDAGGLQALVRDLGASMTEPVFFNYTHPKGKLSIHEDVHLKRFFESPFVTRMHRPAYDGRNRMLAGTFPDPTFNGVLPGMHAWRLADWIGLGLPDTAVPGIADLWLDYCFGVRTVDPHADDDNDGMTNYEEFVARTDPLDRSSALVMDPVQPIGAQMEIRWRSAPYRFYEVAASTNLMQGFEILGSRVPATPPENVFTDTMPRLGHKYYRIRVLP